MQKINDWYIPDYDTHFKEYLATHGNEYQKEPRDFALRQVTKFRNAIDVGGNIGFWSKDLCKLFTNVEIFEPDASNVECLELNLHSHSNYKLHHTGLGHTNTEKEFYKSNTSSGAHTFNPEHMPSGEVSKSFVEIKTLDSYNFNKVDFIKIDTQGSELDILQGARQTLITNDCVLNIEIEQKNPKQVALGRPIFEFMESLGYVQLDRFKRDEVLFAKRKRKITKQAFKRK
jgi:FkbM family methyltransferase